MANAIGACPITLVWPGAFPGLPQALDRHSHFRASVVISGFLNRARESGLKRALRHGHSAFGADEPAFYAFQGLLAVYAKHGGGPSLQPTDSNGSRAKTADPEFPVIDALDSGADFLHKLLGAVLNGVNERLIAMMRRHVRLIHRVVCSVIAKP